LLFASATFYSIHSIGLVHSINFLRFSPEVWTCRIVGVISRMIPLRCVLLPFTDSPLATSPSPCHSRSIHTVRRGSFVNGSVFYSLTSNFPLHCSSTFVPCIARWASIFLRLGLERVFTLPPILLSFHENRPLDPERGPGYPIQVFSYTDPPQFLLSSKSPLRVLRGIVPAFIVPFQPFLIVSGQGPVQEFFTGASSCGLSPHPPPSLVSCLTGYLKRDLFTRPRITLHRFLSL